MSWAVVVSWCPLAHIQSAEKPSPCHKVCPCQIRLTVVCLLPVCLHLAFCLLAGGTWETHLPARPPAPPQVLPKCHTKSLYFAPGKGGSGNRDVCSGCGCMRIGQGSLGLGGDRQAGCWASQAGRGPRGEPWWRWRFPALGVGLSSCFLLIERSDNAVVTQLPPPSMDNSRFVRVS